MTSRIENRIARMTEKFREAGMRVTPQRLAIYEEVARTNEHPDAETALKRVRKRMPTVSLDTVYRTLATLEELGLVARVEASSDRVRFDGNPEPHDHFICRRCGQVKDVQSREAASLNLPSDLDHWGTVESIHVQLRGVCTTCQGRDTEENDS